MSPAGANTTNNQRQEFHYRAFEVATLDDVFRARKHLREYGATTLEDTIADPPPGQRPVLQVLSLLEKRCFVTQFAYDDHPSTHSTH